MQVVTWNTTKTGGAYDFRVYSMDYNTPSVTLMTGRCPTRAQATLQAKKWTRYFKAINAKMADVNYVGSTEHY